jgi:hypothetical protein
VLVANAIYFVPHVDMDEADRQNPEFHREDLDVWYRLVGRVTGLDEHEFATFARNVLWTYHQAIVTLRAPFALFFRWTDTGQQWGLFAIVTENPDELVIEVRREGDWETLYRRLDPVHDWHDAQLKYRRIRGVWDGLKGDEPKGTYKRFAGWVAKEVFEEQPDVDRVRVLLERTHSTWPWEPASTEVKRRAERYIKREKPRP